MPTDGTVRCTCSLLSLRRGKIFSPSHPAPLPWLCTSADAALVRCHLEQPPSSPSCRALSTGNAAPSCGGERHTITCFHLGAASQMPCSTPRHHAPFTVEPPQVSALVCPRSASVSTTSSSRCPSLGAARYHPQTVAHPPPRSAAVPHRCQPPPTLDPCHRDDLRLDFPHPCDPPTGRRDRQTHPTSMVPLRHECLHVDLLLRPQSRPSSASKSTARQP
jgi:hypothetical protein